MTAGFKNPMQEFKRNEGKEMVVAFSKPVEDRSRSNIIFVKLKVDPAIRLSLLFC